MKKIVTIFLLAIIGILTLEASDVARLKAEIVKNMAALLMPGHRGHRIYVDESCKRVEFSVEMIGTVVTNPEAADIVIVCDLDHSRIGYRTLAEKEKALIFLSYRDYLRHKDVAAGAFFWQKGRPNIILNARYLKKHDIKVPESYKMYVE